MIQEIKAYAKANRIPIINDEGLAFLIDVIIKHNVTNILELGSAIGYSAIMMAQTNKVIKIDTIEKDQKRYNLAKNNIEQLNLDNQIKTYCLDANEFKTNKLYDLIFLDLAKSQYEKMINKFYANLKVGGIIVVDNLVLYGLVLEEDLKAKRRVRKLVDKIRKFRSDVVLDKRFDVKFYDDIGDGMGVLYKKGEWD